MNDIAVAVRIIRPGDRERFLVLWQQFVASVPSEPGNHAMGETNWDRAINPENSLQAIVAVDADDEAMGFTLFLTFPFTWSAGDACYLQDIFVTSQHRGAGVARTMIQHLARLGGNEGWYKIFWMTQSDNHAAQRLYDKVAKKMDYIRYDLNLCEP